MVTSGRPGWMMSDTETCGDSRISVRADRTVVGKLPVRTTDTCTIRGTGKEVESVYTRGGSLDFCTGGSDGVCGDRGWSCTVDSRTLDRTGRVTPMMIFITHGRHSASQQDDDNDGSEYGVCYRSPDSWVNRLTG